MRLINFGNDQRALYASVILLIPNTAFAYLDPGSSSIILQALLAIAVGMSMAWKTLFYKVKSFFVKPAELDEDQESQESDENSDK